MNIVKRNADFLFIKFQFPRGDNLLLINIIKFICFVVPIEFTEILDFFI